MHDQTAAAIPYELRIGVTGHRDLDDPDSVRTAMRQLLGRIAEVFVRASQHPAGPHGNHAPAAGWSARWDLVMQYGLAVGSRVVCPAINLGRRLTRCDPRRDWPVIPFPPGDPPPHRQTPLKLTAVSSLARGSDRLLVEALADLLGPGCPEGVVPATKHRRFLEAVLPFPIAEYERDFTSAADRASFAQCLALDQSHGESTAVPTILHPHAPSLDSSRHAAYGAAGRYVADACEILIAIWDPAREERPGGTAETARYAINRGRTVLWIDPRQPATEARMLTNDSAAPPSSQLANVPARLAAHPLPVRAEDYSRNFHRLAAYNRDDTVSDQELRQATLSVTADFKQRAAPLLPEAVTATLSRHVLPHAVRADLLAGRYQSLRRAALACWTTLTAFSVSLMALQILFLPDWHWLAGVELLLLGLCIALYRVSLRDAWHDKWRNDRRLAEALRTAVFTSLVDEQPDEAGAAAVAARASTTARIENPLPFYSSSQSWLVNVVKRLVRREGRVCQNTIDWSRDLPGIREFLSREWLLDQARFHEANTHRRHHAVRRQRIARQTLLFAIAVVAVLHVFGIGHAAHHGEGPLFARVDLWIGWATVVLPTWAAALHALSVSDDQERLAARSLRMSTLLRGAADGVAQADSPLQLRDAVHEAESLMDLEHQEWSESLSERQPEFSG